MKAKFPWEEKEKILNCHPLKYKHMSTGEREDSHLWIYKLWNVSKAVGPRPHPHRQHVTT